MSHKSNVKKTLKSRALGSTDKKHAVLLLAISRLGGAPDKDKTLDYIQEHGLYSFSASDLRPKDNRKELVWRNNFAYRRFDLERKGYLDGAKKNVWRITDAGRQRLQELLREISVRRAAGEDLAPLTESFLEETQAACPLAAGGVAGNEEKSSEPDSEPDKHRRSRNWSEGEGKWHCDTVAAIAANPALVGIKPAEVVRTWHDSVTSNDGRRLWKKLLTGKRPDVVLELGNGGLVVIEVEPITTVFDGIGQLAGDYMINLRVDREAASETLEAEAILVTDKEVSKDVGALINDLSLRQITQAGSNVQ